MGGVSGLRKIFVVLHVAIMFTLRGEFGDKYGV